MLVPHGSNVSLLAMTPNPSLERTSTGKALGPRGGQGISSASRPKRLAGGVRSAQTLGLTTTIRLRSTCMEIAFVGFSLVLFWGVTLATTNAGEDRLQLATVCLFFLVLGYVAFAWRLHERSALTVLAYAVGSYGLLLYAVLGALAIYHRRWAWYAAVGALALQVLVGIIALASSLSAGAVDALLSLQGLLLGAVGLWACLHKGSKALVASSPAGGEA